MDINISQQVSATYARNHFREVTERAQKEGKIIIIHKSSPSLIIMPLEEYKKETARPQKKPKKVTLEELRKNSIFHKYLGKLEKPIPGKTSVDLQNEWYKHID